MFSPIWDCHVGKPPLLSKLAALTWLKRRRTSQGAGIQNQGETLLHKFGVWYFSSSGVWDVYSQVMQSPSLGSGKNELTTLPERSFFLVPGDILLLLGHICCYVVYAEQWGCHCVESVAVVALGVWWFVFCFTSDLLIAILSAPQMLLRKFGR